MKRLPVLTVEADTCAEGWIKALEAVWNQGVEVPNHYEKDLSKEAIVTVNVLNPLREPRVHRADFVATEDIILHPTYVKEVLDGTLDQKVDEGNLSYTYHRRLWHWGKPVPNHDALLVTKNIPIITFFPSSTCEHGIDQIAYLLDKAVEEPISRKLQVTTWQPHKDLKVSGAPCLQRLWFRIINDDDGKTPRYLVMESSWRSRDLVKAWGSNCYAMVDLGKMIATELTKRFGTIVELSQYTDKSSSLHVYGSDYEKVKEIFETIEKRRKIGKAII